MDIAIFKAVDATEFYTEERCYITEISNHSNDNAVSVAKARVTPQTTTAWHRLRNTEERYLIIAGTGLVELGDHPPFTVGIGDLVHIPADMRQRITNTGESDLIFYAICSPRFRPENYLHLE